MLFKLLICLFIHYTEHMYKAFEFMKKKDAKTDSWNTL